MLRISFDLQAAYDSVYIDDLVYKCAQIGIVGPILLLLYRFLSCSIIKVIWRGFLSSTRTTGRGVLQDAVLTPHFIHYFPIWFFEVLEGLDVKFLVYADSYIALIHHWRYARLNYRRLSVWLLSGALIGSCPSAQLNVTPLICLEGILSVNLISALTVASMNRAMPLNSSDFMWLDEGVSVNTLIIWEEKCLVVLI